MSPAEVVPFAQGASREARPPGREDQVSIFVLEPEPLVREAVVASLGLHDRAYLPRGFASLAPALEAALARPPALVIAEVVLPEGPRPLEVLAKLRTAARNAPILALTEAPQVLFRALSPLESLIEKPPDIDYLLRRVDDLVAASAGGVLRGISLPSLLQVLAADRKTCAVSVDGHEARGRIWLAEGRPVHAQSGERRGKEALFRLLGLEAPLLRVRPEVAPLRSLDDTLPALLLEYSIFVDHHHRR